MHRHLFRFCTGVALAAGLLVASGTPAAAQSVSVFGTIAPISGGFSYALSVTYLNLVTPTDTLALVTLNVPAQVGAVANLNPPTGFLMAFDSGLGTLDLAEDSNVATLQTFLAGTTQGQFLFTSPFDLTGTTFDALDSTDVYSGTVNLQAAQSAAPEPASVALLALGVLGGAGVVARRRR